MKLMDFYLEKQAATWFRTWLCLTFWKTAFTSRKTREKPRQTHESSTIQPLKGTLLLLFPLFLGSEAACFACNALAGAMESQGSGQVVLSLQLAWGGVTWKTQMNTQILVICHQSLPYFFLTLNFLHRIGIVNINSGAIQILPAEPIWFAHAHIIYHFCHGLAVLSSKSIGIPSIYLSIILTIGSMMSYFSHDTLYWIKIRDIMSYFIP